MTLPCNLRLLMHTKMLCQISVKHDFDFESFHRLYLLLHAFIEMLNERRSTSCPF